ncbi:hypothetical protein DFA_00747 [Cavenderia fasciculata]|uniref:Uncharacterized protein n=1 Tax=Cavenderia fasciculata TaxID=261658 RepID=F4PTK0_CACFS|nr:uncharacterized protein DFA_00747 [Cavenderia fasciculata]EGG20882.1 hypothetical protein DFA_00747 [Cavenderia fasciculata]|eukprot:XP_004358732.1 hypothetical protein DFA_00747 [Cavenderia fasciculata]
MVLIAPKKKDCKKNRVGPNIHKYAEEITTHLFIIGSDDRSVLYFQWNDPGMASRATAEQTPATLKAILHSLVLSYGGTDLHNNGEAYLFSSWQSMNLCMAQIQMDPALASLRHKNEIPNDACHVFVISKSESSHPLMEQHYTSYFNH